MKERVFYALYSIIAMYLLFLILDRSLSLVFGYNFQPYGPYVPQGFTVWGHLVNGTIAISVMWVWLKLLSIARQRKYGLVLGSLATAVWLFIACLVPYTGDAEHLIKNGSGAVLPWYVAANAAYLSIAGIVILKLVKKTKWRLVFLLALFAAFLLIHVLLYAPMFPEFQWT